MRQFENNRDSVDALKGGKQVDQPTDEENDSKDPVPGRGEKFALVSNPVFRRIFFFVRIVGCIIALASLITEVAYLVKHRFSSLTYWICYLTVCFLKLAIPVFVMLS